MSLDKKQIDSEKILSLIEQAINNIEEKFYQVEYLKPSGAIGKQYRERVWCYEFYHRLRETNLPDDELIINGEIDKSGNDNFIDTINPDFIIHEQGSNDKNLCVIEVKSRLDIEGINKDFCSLTEMLNKHNYKQAVFILINHTFEELKKKFENKPLKNCFNDDIIILCKKPKTDNTDKHTLKELRNIRTVNKKAKLC